MFLKGRNSTESFLENIEEEKLNYFNLTKIKNAEV